MQPVTVDIVTVIVASVASMVVGFLWYSPILFGNQWMVLMGIKAKSKEDLAKMQKDAQPAYLASFVSALVMAYVVAHLVVYLAIETPVQILQFSFWTWLGFIATTQISDVLFSKKPLGLFAINTGFHFVSLVTITCVLVGI